MISSSRILLFRWVSVRQMIEDFLSAARSKRKLLLNLLWSGKIPLMLEKIIDLREESTEEHSGSLSVSSLDSPLLEGPLVLLVSLEGP